MSQIFSHGYALFIGVGRTSYLPWSLQATVHDAQSLLSIFTDANRCAYPHDDQHVQLLHDAAATRQAMLDGLCWLKAQAELDAEATVVVYYSGHGWLDTSTGLYYLIPHDANPQNPVGSALSSETFGDALRAISARRLLVFIDSCHAEGMATAKESQTLEGPPSGFAKMALPRHVIDTLKRGEGRAVFASARGAQVSWIRPDRTMSIYTYHLIEALQGAGNQPGETEVHLSNLMNYLGRAVPASALKFYQEEQVPFFDAATEDFAVALLRGGKGLPVGGWESDGQGDREGSHRTPRVSNERSISIGGDVSNSTLITGDQNRVSSE
jgi:uncharacterized caspase-like protein